MLTFSRARVPLFAHNTRLFLILLSHLSLTFIISVLPFPPQILFITILFIFFFSHSIHHFRAPFPQTFFIVMFFHLQSTFIFEFYFQKQYQYFLLATMSQPPRIFKHKSVCIARLSQLSIDSVIHCRHHEMESAEQQRTPLQLPLLL
jgi:hypothetical protein